MERATGGWEKDALCELYVVGHNLVRVSPRVGIPVEELEEVSRGPFGERSKQMVTDEW